MKCMFEGTIVGKGVVISRKDGKEYPWFDVYSDGECLRVFGVPFSDYEGYICGESVEWPVRISVYNGDLSVRYLTR